MSGKKLKNSKTQENITKDEWPIVIYFSAFLIAFLGYLLGEFTLSKYSHIFHWLALLVGGLVGIPLGWLYFRWRGDIF